MAYIGTSPSNGVRRRFVYEATASQTSFSGSDENGVTLTYVDSLYLDVYQNGIKLKAGDDYTATTGTTVVLVQGASLNDVVEMVAFDVFSVGDTVSAKDGGNFAGNVAMAGTLGVTGTLTANGGAVFNEASADVDFRVETNGNANTLFVDGGNNNVGIGTASPAAAAKLQIDGGRCYISANSDAFALYLRYNVDTGGVLLGSPATDEFTLCRSGGQTHLKIDATGAVTMPLQPAFSVHKNGADQSNMPIADTTVTWTHERFDANADFDLTNNRFVAPVTGKYFLSFMARLEAVDSGAAFYLANIVTSNQTYRYIIDPNFTADLNYFKVQVTVLADMDANDTATVTFIQNGGTQQTDIDGDATETFYMGHLVA